MLSGSNSNFVFCRVNPPLITPPPSTDDEGIWPLIRVSSTMHESSEATSSCSQRIRILVALYSNVDCVGKSGRAERIIKKRFCFYVVVDLIEVFAF